MKITQFETLKVLPSWVWLKIHTGEGITALDLPHIFDRFYRADRARGGDTGGAGLGLTIARKIVEAHGGTIEAESELGQGSVFRIYIPQVAVKDEIPSTAAP